jgi:hypothetical protein
MGVLPQASYRLTTMEGMDIPGTRRRPSTDPFAAPAFDAWRLVSRQPAATMPEWSQHVCSASPPCS